MKRWKKILLVAFLVFLVALFAALHSPIGRMIVGFALTPRIEAKLEPALDATVLVGALDYRFWLMDGRGRSVEATLSWHGHGVSIHEK